MTTLPLTGLILSPLNCRQDSEPPSEEMLASIGTYGIIEPLIVHPYKTKGFDGHGVLAGGRRLNALLKLFDYAVSTNVFDPSLDFEAIPVVIRDGTPEQLREISVIENTHRVNLKPHEEFAAYASFSGEPEEIAGRFGVTVRHVKQRLRLGRLHPTVFAALASGEISLDVAQAYGASDDHDLQLRVFKKQKGGHYEYQVRQAIKGASDERDVQQKLLFVGRDAYAAAGGTLVEDLFTDREESFIVNDLKLLDRLFDVDYERRLAILTERVGARHVADRMECGAFVQPDYGELATPEMVAEYQALEAEQQEKNTALEAMREDETNWSATDDAALEARLFEIKNRLIALDQTRPIIFPEGKEIVFTTCVRNGMIHATGYYEARGEVVGLGGGGVPSTGPVPAKPEPAADPGPKITKKALEDLANMRRQVLINLFDDNDPVLHGVASNLLLFTLARGGYNHSTPANFRYVRPGENGALPPKFLDAPWFTEEVEEVAFVMFCAQDTAEIESVAQALLGRMIEPHLATDMGVLKGLGQWLLTGERIRSFQYWVPTGDFFAMFSKKVICSMVAEVDPGQASLIAKMRTSEAVERAVSFFKGDVSGMSEELQQQARAWVPSWLVFHVKQPAVPVPTIAELAKLVAYQDIAASEPPRPIEGDPAEVFETYEAWMQQMEASFPANDNPDGGGGPDDARVAAE